VLSTTRRTDGEAVLPVLREYRARAAKEPQEEILFEIGLRLPLPGHADSGEDQEGAEDVDRPLEGMEERRSGDDEDRPEDQRPEHAPDEDAVLVGRRHLEGTEDEGENEEVVDRERLLDQIAGQELDRRLRAPEEIEPEVEEERERYPDRAPRRRLAPGHGVRLAVEDSDVQGEKEEDEEVEGDPEPERCVDHGLSPEKDSHGLAGTLVALGGPGDRSPC
jgi:hypothetical protein